MFYRSFSLLLIALLFSSCSTSTDSKTKDAEILDFSIKELPGIQFKIDQSAKLIQIKNHEDFDPQTSIKELTAVIKLSEGATAFVNDTLQVYAQTVNNFTGGLIYTVISEDKHKKQDYFVHLEEDVPISYLIEGSIGIDLDPYGIAPLSAIASIKTKKESHISIHVLGDEPILKTFPGFNLNHEVPILGLYPNKKNLVEVSISDRSGIEVVDTLAIQTAPLPEFLPEVDIHVIDESKMEPGFHFNDFHVGNAGSFNSYPLIFDNDGNIRWYLDLSKFNRIVWPIQFNEDGSFFAVFGVTIIEYDMTGRELNRIVVEENNMHHEVIKLPNGNYVVAVSRVGATMIKDGEEITSVEDYIIEVDPSGTIITEWDMGEILDVNRISLTDGGMDWFHMNAIWHDESDNSLIISGRNQGLVKVNWKNELQWILAPHKGWGRAGRTGEGSETAPFLLTAVDNSGNPFEAAIQQGEIESDEFSWTWGQHAPVLLPNGNLFVFDNGYKRNFGAASNYSMATEYKIDEENMTAEMVWSYGKDRGEETFSNIISDVDYLPETGNRLFLPGIVNSAGSASKIVELTEDKEVVFESSLKFKNMLTNGQGWGNMDITYRAERVPLYW